MALELCRMIPVIAMVTNCFSWCMTDDVLQNVNLKAKDQWIYGQYYCFHYLWGSRLRWIFAVIDEQDFRSQSSGEAIKREDNTTGHELAQDGCDKLQFWMIVSHSMGREITPVGRSGSSQIVKSSAGWLVYVIACGINDDFIAVRLHWIGCWPIIRGDSIEYACSTWNVVTLLCERGANYVC